jgi:hypothetical protein
MSFHHVLKKQKKLNEKLTLSDRNRWRSLDSSFLKQLIHCFPRVWRQKMDQQHALDVGIELSRVEAGSVSVVAVSDTHNSATTQHA